MTIRAAASNVEATALKFRLRTKRPPVGKSRAARSATNSTTRIGELEREIAELRQRELELQRRAEQALAVAVGVRNDEISFGEAPAAVLSAISHDLRTPLNAVIGFATLLQSEIHGGLGHPKYRDYARHIEVSGQSILRSTCEILKLADLGVERVGAARAL